MGDLKKISNFKKGISGSQKGLTLVEILVVLVVAGIALLLMQTVFGTNLAAFDEHIIRANLWQEANALFEQITKDARMSGDIVMADPDGSEEVQLLDSDGDLIGIYTIMNDGRMVYDTGGATLTVCDHVDPGESSFQRKGRALLVDLVLTQGSLSRPVTVTATTEIYPRNN